MAEVKPKKRIVKNPETFRERAVKAAVESEQPGRRRRFAGGVGRAVRPVFRLIARPFAYLGRYKAFRVIGWILFPRYLRNSWQELKLVTWPSWRESRRLTFAVLVFAVIFGASIAVVDWGLDKVFKDVLLK